MIVLVGNNEWTDRRVKGLELMSWLGEVKKKKMNRTCWEVLCTLGDCEHGSADRQQRATERGRESGRPGVGSARALRVAQRLFVLMQEPHYPGLLLATHEPCVPEARL